MAGEGLEPKVSIYEVDGTRIQVIEEDNNKDGKYDTKITILQREGEYNVKTEADTDLNGKLDYAQIMRYTYHTDGTIKQAFTVVDREGDKKIDLRGRRFVREHPDYPGQILDEVVEIDKNGNSKADYLVEVRRDRKSGRITNVKMEKLTDGIEEVKGKEIAEVWKLLNEIIEQYRPEFR